MLLLSNESTRQERLSESWKELKKHTNDGDIVLGSLELPEGNVDGDTTLTLGLELVKNPRVLERALSELSSFESVSY